jgi:hypothetical protein
MNPSNSHYELCFVGPPLAGWPKDCKNANKDGQPASGGPTKQTLMLDESEATQAPALSLVIG